MGAFTLPSVREFELFLSDQKDVLFTSFLKSSFHYITEYFKEKPFTQENLRIMLNELRTITSVKGKCLKKSTLNKYIRCAKLIAKCAKSHEFDDFTGYKCKEELTSPKGDLITVREAKMIIDCPLKRVRFSHRSHEQMMDRLNLFNAIFKQMFYLGTPPVDIVNMKRENDRGDHYDYYRHKTSKHMIVPIPAPLRHALDLIPRKSEYLFSGPHGQMNEETIRVELRRRCKILNIRKVITPYSFRYCAVTFCYASAPSDASISALSDIFGHSIDIAKKHYVLWKDPRKLSDALYACHPGLQKKVDCDNIKRLALDFLSKLVDTTKYEVELTIQPKAKNVRHLTIS